MIAVIAGTGSLPIQACKSLQERGKSFFVIVLFPDDNLAQINEQVSDSATVITRPFYKARAILDLLKERNTKQVFFIGKVDKKYLLKRFKLDLFALKILATLATKSDFSIMDKIAEILSQHGIEVISQHEVLGSLLLKPGILTGRLTKEQKASVEFGIAMAKQMSACDIGQTVVVKDKMILAVEAIEGTDACIKRGVALGKENVVVCKAANRNHNQKFDLPTIGTATLESLERGQVSVLAWDASKTLIADKEKLIARARALGITLVAV